MFFTIHNNALHLVLLWDILIILGFVNPAIVNANLAQAQLIIHAHLATQDFIFMSINATGLVP